MLSKLTPSDPPTEIDDTTTISRKTDFVCEFEAQEAVHVDLSIHRAVGCQAKY